jgi:hypothetical protein
VRRKYKIDTSRRRKLLPAEVPYVESMVALLKVAGYSQIQISKVVGISRLQVRDMLLQPGVIETIVMLREGLPAAALELMQGYMVEAVQTIVDVMRTSEDESLVLKAAAEILDRGGAPKASRQDRHNLNEARTTFADDGIVDRLRQASPEVQEEAAQLIEKLEFMLTNQADVILGGEDDDGPLD